MANAKNKPKDLEVMSNILKKFGITHYDSEVENVLLDFSIKYITNIIEDAQLYSSHAKKKSLDVDDVKLAIELRLNNNYSYLPSREVTAALARQRNSLPLPTIRSSAGLRLPPDRYNLTACNFSLKSSARKPRSVNAVSRVNVSNITPMIPRPTFSVSKPVQCPIAKFSDANKGIIPTSASSPMSSSTSAFTTPSASSQIFIPTVLNNETKLTNDWASNKRTYKEDDDYDDN